MKKITTVSTIFSCVLIALGFVLFSPTIVAKTEHKTLAFDKKLEKKQDFVGGHFKNVTLDERDGHIELGPEEGVNRGEYTTPVVEAPFVASHIGLHWKEKYNQEKPLSVSIRTSADGESFGEWTALTVNAEERKNGKKNEEQFAALLGVSESRFAQAKIEFQAHDEQQQKMKHLTFTFINATQEAEVAGKKLTFVPRITAQSTGITKTSPHGQNVSVISREEWGADESYRNNSSGGEDWPRSYHGTRKLVMHHTADLGSNGATDIEANKATVRATYYYHAVTKAWGDIGYNVLVDAAGNVYEGRYGTPGVDHHRSNPTSEQIMVMDVEAAHTASYNSGSFGVAAMGHFNDFDVPSAQREGMNSVFAYAVDNRGIDMRGQSDFLRYDGAWHNNLDNFFAHKDAVNTECPGDRLYPEITSIKNEVSARSGMPPNLQGFSATVDGVAISGQSVGAQITIFDWTDFSTVAHYRYAVEKVFGTVYDPQPYDTAWMNEVHTQQVTNSEVSMDLSVLDPLSQYVFYVVAVDGNNTPLSTVSHVNFKTNELTSSDAISPTVSINSPVEGYEATAKERLTISVEASDDTAVTVIEILFDGNVKASCTDVATCTTVVQMRKESIGAHSVEARAYDAAGNVGSAVVHFTKVDSSSGGSDEPKPEKCTPWPACKRG